jgi:hypothetical protein
VTPSGHEFAMIVRAGAEVQMIVIQNWAKEVREKLRTHQQP